MEVRQRRHKFTSVRFKTRGGLKVDTYYWKSVKGKDISYQLRIHRSMSHEDKS